MGSYRPDASNRVELRLQALPATAGPLSDLLPNSAPKARFALRSFECRHVGIAFEHWKDLSVLASQTENNEKLFERDLGEGRKLVPEPDQVKDVGSRLPAPLPFSKAQRATPDMKVGHSCAAAQLLKEVS